MRPIKNYAATLATESTYKETKGDSQIVITIYKSPQGFLYSVNCKLKRLVRSQYPQPSNTVFATEKEAHRAALSTIKSWLVNSRKLQKVFWQFDLSDCDQMELDFG